MPRSPRRRRRARGAARPAACLSLAAIGLALASIPTAVADPAADHANSPDARVADTRVADAKLVDDGAGGDRRQGVPRLAARRCRASQPSARDGRPATLPTIDPAAIPWDEIAGFMREHSPLKWERWEQYNRAYGGGHGPGARGWRPGPAAAPKCGKRSRKGFATSTAQLKKIESADAGEYKLMVRRVELEDKVFGAQAEFRAAPAMPRSRGPPPGKSRSTSTTCSPCRTR